MVIRSLARSFLYSGTTEGGGGTTPPTTTTPDPQTFSVDWKHRQLIIGDFKAFLITKTADQPGIFGRNPHKPRI